MQRQVPARSTNASKNQGFMKNIPTKDDDLDDFDDDEWAQKKGPNPMLRQQYNAMRPQTSGKPGQRGFHGIGKKPQQNSLLQQDPDDLDDVLDGMGLA